MKKIAFIIPWGGKLPAYFKLWTATCRQNPTVDFLIFTSSREVLDIPDNVKIYHKSFEELKKLFQEKFDFQISLSQPYKFCDFKPAYGDIFSAYLKGYEFWGHCDMDLFWGDIRSYVTDEILDRYDRIYSRGPCSLYRNTPEVNQWYKTLPAKGFQDWKEVLQSSEACCFDEWAGHAGGGISYIIQANDIPVYDAPDMADLDVSKGYFRILGRDSIKKKGIYFQYEQGKLYICDKENILSEILFCHFQKRQIEFDKNDIDAEKFYFIAPGYVTSRSMEIKRKRTKEALFQMRYYKNKIKKKLRLMLHKEDPLEMKLKVIQRGNRKCLKRN